ncbi:MAG: hypothetical protein D6160_19510, partial [Ketobacter sp.]
HYRDIISPVNAFFKQFFQHLSYSNTFTRAKRFLLSPRSNKQPAAPAGWSRIRSVFQKSKTSVVMILQDAEYF